MVGIHLILALDEGVDPATVELRLRSDHEAWRVLDGVGMSVGVGYLARLGVDNVVGLPEAQATYLTVIKSEVP